MQLITVQNYTSPVVDEFVEKMAALNLMYYASDIASEMDFDSVEEMQEAVKRAIDICITAEIPMKGNFQRVYKSTADGIIYDWMLSMLAYKLVCISGKSSNPNVAHLIIQLLKNEHLNNF